MSKIHTPISKSFALAIRIAARKAIAEFKSVGTTAVGRQMLSQKVSRAVLSEPSAPRGPSALYYYNLELDGVIDSHSDIKAFILK